MHNQVLVVYGQLANAIGEYFYPGTLLHLSGLAVGGSFVVLGQFLPLGTTCLQGLTFAVDVFTQASQCLASHLALAG